MLSQNLAYRHPESLPKPYKFSRAGDMSIWWVMYRVSWNGHLICRICLGVFITVSILIARGQSESLLVLVGRVEERDIKVKSYMVMKD